jgi:hypothetical protein
MQKKKIIFFSYNLPKVFNLSFIYCFKDEFCAKYTGGSVSNLGQFEEFARRLDEIAAQVPQVRLHLHNTDTSV